MLTDEAMDSQRQLEESVAQRNAFAAEVEALQLRVDAAEAALEAAESTRRQTSPPLTELKQTASDTVVAMDTPPLAAGADGGAEKVLAAANREIQMLQVRCLVGAATALL